MPQAPILQPGEVIAFWFTELESKNWFSSDPAIDRKVAAALGGASAAALDGKLDAWADAAESCLALVLLLDQVPRNVHRGRPESFAGDAKALAHARRAIARDFDRALPQRQRSFLFMPFLHSEDLAMHDEGLRLIRERLPDESGTLKWAEHHRQIIAEFGRFPHRNAILGRADTAAERAFLAAKGKG